MKEREISLVSIFLVICIVFLIVGVGIYLTEKRETQTKKEAVKKVEPITKKAKATQKKYTTKEVWNFTCNYEVRPGQTVAQLTDLAILIMRADGHTAEVIEGMATPYSNNVWRVSCVVLIDGFERNELRWETDMDKKKVRPLNKLARDLWGPGEF